MTRAAERWDAIVVGASFAGLAAAMELAGHGRVLLLDKDAIGDNQTSACATPLAVLERLELLESLEQVHEALVLHLPGGIARTYPFAYPFATFDYRRLCQLLAARTDATFRRAWVRTVDSDRVVSSEGAYSAPVVIDASGWRCVLGSTVEPGLRGVATRSIGLEAGLPWQSEPRVPSRRGAADGPAQGLHFWVADELARDGYLWDFPAGAEHRVGLLRYRSGGGLKPRLRGFLGRDAEPEELHGGVLPSRFRAPSAGSVFLVGDAAGQCLPLSGEGIRPALVFGQLAGRLAAQVLDGDLPLEAALDRYRRLARRPLRKYQLLAVIERSMRRLPRRPMDAVSWYLGAGPLSRYCQDAYWRIAPAEWLRPGGVASPLRTA